MENLKGCVYFFRHIGLTPVKIGYSESESPIIRFNQFRTYAPFGSEIIGFIQTCDAKELETTLHKKFASKRLLGEWFEITEKEAQSEINFYSSIEDVRERNEFQVEWAQKLHNKRNNIQEEMNKYIEKNHPSRLNFIKIYRENPNINKSKIAEQLNVSRTCIYNWIKEME
jgi:DNA-binding transcriptional regulator YiaG